MLAAALAAAAGIGCAGLTPYAEVREAVPDESWVEVDGRQIHVVQQGEGPAVLLLHGFAASSYSWRELMPLLAGEFHLIAPDLHGFGWTERPREPDAYHPAGQVTMVRHLLDALGVDDCVIVGHSYGGGLALLLAQQQPDRTTGLVLVAAVDPYTRAAAPTPDADEGRRPTWIGRASSRVAYAGARWLVSEPRMFRRALGQAYADRSMVTSELAEAYRTRLAVEGFDHAWHGFTSAGGRWPAMEPDLIPPTMPVAVIAGSRDRIVPPRAVRRLAGRWPDVGWHALDGVGHMPMEEAPEAVAQVIRELAERGPERHRR